MKVYRNREVETTTLSNSSPLIKTNLTKKSKNSKAITYEQNLSKDLAQELIKTISMKKSKNWNNSSNRFPSSNSSRFRNSDSNQG